MRSRGIEPDVTMHLLNCAACLQPGTQAESISFDVTWEKWIFPNVVTYTSVIKCVASCGRLAEAEFLLDEMTRNGVCPSPATYNCFIKDYRGRKDVDGTMKLHRKTKGVESFTPPNMHTYNILVDMFSKLNQMELVRELWNDTISQKTTNEFKRRTMHKKVKSASGYKRTRQMEEQR
ncbi:hypothetical protein Taro_056887 [Colocasia esculenta]|uniref:Pentatricopeptide repeat-containing protein n=1 Tax=Colocasia esculenta TaxID=4460 RepID=A0A843XYQ9_COLES|nr:hypothetical protein [Colocasia esculenta]